MCVTFKMDIEHINIKERPHVSRTAWWKASDEQLVQYKEQLKNNLDTIKFDNEMFTCININCIKD